MKPSRAARAVAAVALAITPSYLVERITEYYFLTSSPAFGNWSGNRWGLFITLILTGALLAGLFLKEFRLVTVSYLAGVCALISLFYIFCDPKVCYSTGLDGLEPLRMAYFFGCIAVAGSTVGVMRGPRGQIVGPLAVALGIAVFTAVSYLPVIYTVGGTNLLYPFHPWPLVALLLLLSFSVGAIVSSRAGRAYGVATPVVALAIVIGLSSGIANQYPAYVVQLTALLLPVALAGGLAGTYAANMSSHDFLRALAPSTKVFLVVVLLAILLMLPSTPDAVAGVSPTPPTGQTSQLGFASPVYAGGFMSGGLIRSQAVAVNVTFAGTNASAIQSDNYLSAGMGVHAAGCCVDGIDYGYRLDVYLFHDGGEELVASAWQICDHVSACGGHPWRNLMLSKVVPVTFPVTANLRLVIQWEGRFVVWDYSYGGATLVVANLSGTSQENPVFDLGTFGGGPFGFAQSGSYFFQFGVMSRYPIGHPGWSATFVCPAYLNSSEWACVPHAATLQGSQSYWKALWRWGEDYQGVSASAKLASKSVTFVYGSTTMTNFRVLW